MIKVLYSNGKIEEKEYDEAKRVARHTASHVLAQAVKKVYPDAKLAIGPATDEGFYYDFDNLGITEGDLKKLENIMKNIISEGQEMKVYEVSREKALEMMKDEPYKLELIRDLPENATITMYENGPFVDMCAGPHLTNTKDTGAIKLMSTTGAYWRGSEKNKMLTRIYGVCFKTEQEIEKYLADIEEAKKRDHKKLGKELGLFMMADEGPGFPFFLPKGMVLRNVLEDYWRRLHTKAGYVEVKTPIMLNEDLWHRSGHWDHYKDNMYTTKIDDVDFALKPMNCPGGMLVYKSSMHSYREFPIRMGELGLVHRHEKSGQLNGLFRVRCFTQDDAHIFCLPEQIESEIIDLMNLINTVYSEFGFKYTVELSTRPEDSMGDDSVWEMAEEALKKALEHQNMPYVINEGDGAFYGPKIDFHIKDCLGREWQCGTIQLDFQMPERFDLTYIGEDGEKHRPVMLHRVVFGSIERFIGILIEHFAGAFPTWLAPVQIKLLTINDNMKEFASAVKVKLEDAGIRVELDDSNEKLGYKIRNAKLEKVPYFAVIGEKEVETNTLSIKDRENVEFVVTPEELVKKLQDECRGK